MIKFYKNNIIKILKKNNCFKCHSIYKNNILPSFKIISKKYKINLKNKKYLINKVKIGSYNIWGNNIMPAFKIKKKIIKNIVNWIFNIKNQ